jgi:DNA-binding GntR family transcriptional regulator
MGEMRRQTGGDGALVDEAVAQLESAILAGEIGPGERISEQTLSTRFGIGRGALREAVRTLEGRRLLERKPYAGVRVVDLSLSEFGQLLIVREALEGMAARQAAENMSLLETQRLRQCLSTYGETIETEGLGSVFRQSTSDNDFHVMIVRGSRNNWLHEMLCRDLYSILRIFRLKSVAIGSRSEQAAAEHLAILQAIERRDPDAAEHSMRRHIENARNNILALMESSPSAAERLP